MPVPLPANYRDLVTVPVPVPVNLRNLVPVSVPVKIPFFCAGTGAAFNETLGTGAGAGDIETFGTGAVVSACFSVPVPV